METETTGFSKDELVEAKRQIDSTLHKLRAAVKTLASKGDGKRYQAQITLAQRRVRAFEIAGCLVEKAIKIDDPSSN